MSHETNAGKYILKLIIFFGIAAFIIWQDYHNHGALRLGGITTALAVSAIAYLLLTFLSLFVRAFGNYLIGTIVFVIIAVLVGQKLNTIEKAGWFNDNQAFYCTVAIGAILVIWDVIKIIHCLKPQKQATPSDIPDNKMHIKDQQ